MPDVTRIPRPPRVDADPRLRRLRHLAWLLDQSFTIGGKRFGLDPLLGLIPGLGDWAGAGLSLYVVYEAMRLGVPWPVIARMLGNIAIEALVGTVPVAGDIFDFVWQANIRNLQLVDRHYRPHHRPRSMRAIGALFFLICLAVLALLLATISVTVWLIHTLWSALMQ
jgi:hypothetical protein